MKEKELREQRKQMLISKVRKLGKEYTNRAIAKTSGIDESIISRIKNKNFSMSASKVEFYLNKL